LPVFEALAGRLAVQECRIYVEQANEPFLAAGGSGEQFRAGIAALAREPTPRRGRFLVCSIEPQRAGEC